MKQFDERFRENVNKVFSNYNVDHLADEGWNSFLAKRNALGRPKSVMPLLARAASFLLIIGFGFLIAYRILIRPSVQELISADESLDHPYERLSDTDESKKTVVGSAHIPLNSFENKENLKEKRAGEIQEISAEKAPLFEVLTAQEKISVSGPIGREQLLNKNRLPELENLLAIDVLRGNKIPVDLIYDDHSSADFKYTKKSSEKKERYRGRMFMAGFSGLFAQSGNINSAGSGLSMGFYLDQQITKNISLRPGLAFAKQSFEVGNGNVPAELNYNIELVDGTIGIPYSFNGQLSMMAVELPINVVFSIAERKRSEFFVSAGASSMIYLNQHFIADFVNELTRLAMDANTGMYHSETRLTNIEVQSNYGSFSRADLFGLVNLSAGYSFPYSRAGSILIEPFFQVPVNDLTNLNLRIKYGGMSLKLQFGKRGH